MNTNDVILNLVDRLLTEKEENIILKQKIEQQNQQLRNREEKHQQ